MSEITTNVDWIAVAVEAGFIVAMAVVMIIVQAIF